MNDSAERKVMNTSTVGICFLRPDKKLAYFNHIEDTNQQFLDVAGATDVIWQPLRDAHRGWPRTPKQALCCQRLLHQPLGARKDK